MQKAIFKHALEELEDVDTEESSVLENKGYIESIQASRDNAKIRKKSTEHGAEFVISGIEGEEHIHYAMSMRVMSNSSYTIVHFSAGAKNHNTVENFLCKG